MLVATWCLRLGIDVPRELSLAAFHESTVECGALRVATCVLPFERVGYEAVRMLDAKVAGGGGAVPSVALPGELDEAATLAPPPATN